MGKSVHSSLWKRISLLQILAFLIEGCKLMTWQPLGIFVEAEDCKILMFIGPCIIVIAEE